MQRDRAFLSYQDLEARYELRPSAWVEPMGDWGAGRVELVQFPRPTKPTTTSLPIGSRDSWPRSGNRWTTPGA